MPTLQSQLVTALSFIQKSEGQKTLETGVHVTQSAAFKVKSKQKHNSYTRKPFKGCVLVT